MRPTAYPLLHLARQLVHGHKMIADRIAEHTAQAAAEADARRAVGGATRAALAQSQNGADGGTPASPVG